MLQNLRKNLAHFHFQNACGGFGGEHLLIHQFLDPSFVLLKLTHQGNAGENGMLNAGQLLLQSGGQHCQAHNFNQADIFLLDVVQLCVGMVDTQRMLLGCNIVAQHQIQLVILTSAAGNGGDGVVGLAAGLRIDESGLIGVDPPSQQDLGCQIAKLSSVGTGQTKDAHRPLDDAGLDILKALEFHSSLNGCALHGEAEVTALEVLMGQDAAADDGQVSIGADEVVRELGHKVQQLFNGCLIDDHRGVLGVEYDAVLGIVHIGAVLQVPVFSCKLHGNDPVILPGRMIHSTGIALVFYAQQALGIVGLGSCLCGSDGLGILFRLAQVDGDIQIAILSRSLPAHILLDTVAADVVGVLAEAVVPFGSFLRALFVQSSELAANFSGQRSQDAHQLGVEQVTAGDVIGDDAFADCVVRQTLQNLL